MYKESIRRRTVPCLRDSFFPLQVILLSVIKTPLDTVDIIMIPRQDFTISSQDTMIRRSVGG